MWQTETQQKKMAKGLFNNVKLGSATATSVQQRAFTCLNQYRTKGFIVTG
jgi:hypothetical protein